MKWQRGRRSSNIEDERSNNAGSGMRLSGGKISIAGIVMVVAFGLITKQDPMQILSQVLGQLGGSGSSVSTPSNSAPTTPNQIDHSRDEFISTVLGDTEDTWTDIFKQQGKTYQPPKLVLFSGSVSSGCGYASAAVGPFYCPADQKLYLDTSFFAEMKSRFKVGTDFAQAYVIAHEVGHHVQRLTGIDRQVTQAERQGAAREGANGLSVRQELQADCYAGVWGHDAESRYNWLEPGEIEDALKAADAIGDDNLQRQGQGRVVPDSFTHGTAEQRVRWFKVGFDSGDMTRCDTFSAKQL